MSSTMTYAPTVPLPAPTLAALTYVYHARGLSSRRLASSIGTTHPHVGRIMAGSSRPSVILAERIGAALDLPPEFTALMMEQSSKVGRKMRYGDDFEGTPAPIGSPLCPVAAAQAHALMRYAIMAGGWPALASEFEARLVLHSIEMAPAMGSPLVFGVLSLDPWDEFNTSHTAPLLVWMGKPLPPASLTLDTLGEFIASVPPSAVIHCVCHDRR